MEVRPIANRYRGQLPAQCFLALLLLGDLAPDLRELLHGALHPRQPPLELSDRLERQPAPIA